MDSGALKKGAHYPGTDREASAGGGGRASGAREASERMGEHLPLTVPLLATSVQPRHHPPGARNAIAITGGNRPRD